jgi:hypothetical protein
VGSWELARSQRDRIAPRNRIFWSDFRDFAPFSFSPVFELFRDHGVLTQRRDERNGATIIPLRRRAVASLRASSSHTSPASTTSQTQNSLV